VGIIHTALSFSSAFSWSASFFILGGLWLGVILPLSAGKQISHGFAALANYIAAFPDASRLPTGLSLPKQIFARLCPKIRNRVLNAHMNYPPTKRLTITSVMLAASAFR
jgi:hypothetical protein